MYVIHKQYVSKNMLMGMKPYYYYSCCELLYMCPLICWDVFSWPFLSIIISKEIPLQMQESNLTTNSDSYRQKTSI